MVSTWLREHLKVKVEDVSFQDTCCHRELGLSMVAMRETVKAERIVEVDKWRNE